MIKRILLLLVAVFIACSLFACNKQSQVVYIAGEGGTIAGESVQAVTHGGTSSSVTAVANEGYVFVKWSDGITNVTRNDAEINKNIEVTAEFAKKTYDVKYHAGVGGVVSGDSVQTVAHGGTASSVTAVANEGYVFVKWSDGITNITRNDAVINSDIEITAEFAKKTYDVKYHAGVGGVVSGDSVQTVAHGGTSSSVTAVANEGYVFVKWSDGITNITRNDAEINKNIEVTAEFALDTYTVKYYAGIGGTVNGNLVQNVLPGNSTTPVTAIANVGYKFFGWSSGLENAEITLKPNGDATVTAIFLKDELNLPILSIITEDFSPINTKEDYVKCSVSVTNTDSVYEFSSVEGKIKLRGNSTAYLPKSPYKLKFDKKVDLFGNGSAKTWTIIANYVDCSLIRNYIAYSLGAEFDNLNYTTSLKTVEVYVNGRYDGVYLICEQVEAGSNRVNIDEDYSTADTGYLIELDDRAPDEGVEGIDYFNIIDNYKTRSYAIKSPDTEEEDFSAAHVAYIKDYIEQCMAALDGDDFGAVTALIDVYSFADGYIIDELMHCADVGISSFYMYKDKGGKLSRGPLWDYDLSAGNYSNYDAVVNVNYLWAREANIWYKKLLGHEEFVAIVASRLEQLEDKITTVINDCYSFVINNRESFERNFERWEILGVPSNAFTPEEIYEIETWEEHVEYVISWLSLCLQNMKNCYPVVN